MRKVSAGLWSDIMLCQGWCPGSVGLAVRLENGEFEQLDLTPFSFPPDLPDVMKSQETNGQEQSS